MSQPLLPLIQRHLRTTRQSETRFGRIVCGDPNLMRDLRNGRTPRRQLDFNIREFIAKAGDTQIGSISA